MIGYKASTNHLIWVSTNTTERGEHLLQFNMAYNLDILNEFCSVHKLIDFEIGGSHISTASYEISQKTSLEIIYLGYISTCHEHYIMNCKSWSVVEPFLVQVTLSYGP